MLMKFTVSEVLSTMLVPRDAGQAQLRSLAHRVDFEYDPRPGFLYVRSRAISSRCNDNHDEFPAAEIKKAFKSFVGKPVFVNHNNDNHRRARGVVIDAALHEDKNPDGTPDTWAEVLMEVDAIRFPKLAEALIKGHIDRTSMGTDVAYSICSACGNKASSPSEYCEHIPRLKGKRLYKAGASGNKEGILIREICYGLGFFENSLLVEEPADPTAYVWGLDTRGIDKKASKKTAAWSQAQHPEPIVHIVGRRPPRPLQTGDTLMHPETGYSAPITAHTENLLQADGRTYHRGPMEGDYSKSIWSSEVYDEAGQDVPGYTDEQRKFMDGNEQGPTKYSSKTASGNPAYPNGQCDHCGFGLDDETHCTNEDCYEAPCNHPRCAELNEPFHTNGEHIDPDDPYSDEAIGTTHEVDKHFAETPGLEDAGFLLDQQRQGPTKYSSKTASTKDPDDGYDDDGNIPLGEEDMAFFRQMHEQGQQHQEMHEHNQKRVVNLADPADCKSHLFEAHGWDESDLWRNSHPADHPRMFAATDEDRPLSNMEIRAAHGQEHQDNREDFPHAQSLYGSHFHTASKMASYEDFHTASSYSERHPCGFCDAQDHNSDGHTPCGHCDAMDHDSDNHEEQSEKECQHCGSENHYTEDHQHCDYCHRNHETDDHEDEPEDDDGYLIPGGRHSVEVLSNGDHLGAYPDRETAVHALLHHQHDERYFPNVWDADGNHEDISEHTRRWAPNLGGSGKMHEGAQPVPEHEPVDEFSSEDETRAHLLEHHGQDHHDLTGQEYRPGTSSRPGEQGRYVDVPYSRQQLQDHHEDLHEPNEDYCPAEGEDCPYRRSGHRHRGFGEVPASSGVGADRSMREAWESDAARWRPQHNAAKVVSYDDFHRTASRRIAVAGECYTCLSHEHETEDHDSSEDGESYDAARWSPGDDEMYNRGDARARQERQMLDRHQQALERHQRDLNRARDRADSESSANEHCTNCGGEIYKDHEGSYTHYHPDEDGLHDTCVDDDGDRQPPEPCGPSGPFGLHHCSAVDMNREKPVRGMTFNPDSHYRMLGAAGWNDFQQHGTIRAKPNSKQDYGDAYFAKGSALERYRSRSTSHDYVAEVHDQAAMKTNSRYPVAARPLGPQDVTVHRIDNKTNKIDVVHSPDRPHPAFHIDPKTSSYENFHTAVSKTAASQWRSGFPCPEVDPHGGTCIGDQGHYANHIFEGGDEEARADATEQYLQDLQDKRELEPGPDAYRWSPNDDHLGSRKTAIGFPAVGAFMTGHDTVHPHCEHHEDEAREAAFKESPEVMRVGMFGMTCPHCEASFPEPKHEPSALHLHLVSHHGFNHEDLPGGRYYGDRFSAMAGDDEFPESWRNKPDSVVKQLHADEHGHPDTATGVFDYLGGINHTHDKDGGIAPKTATTDRWTTCDQGHTHWGSAGAAGLLMRHTDDEGTKRFYLQQRSPWVQHGGTYSIPGGALHHGESPQDGAHREATEEMGDLPPMRHARTHSDEHGGWGYHTVIADVDHQFEPEGDDGHEHAGGGWHTSDEMKDLPLHPGFSSSWGKIKAESHKTATDKGAHHDGFRVRQYPTSGSNGFIDGHRNYCDACSPRGVEQASRHILAPDTRCEHPKHDFNVTVSGVDEPTEYEHYKDHPDVMGWTKDDFTSYGKDHTMCTSCAEDRRSSGKNMETYYPLTKSRLIPEDVCDECGHDLGSGRKEASRVSTYEDFSRMASTAEPAKLSGGYLNEEGDYQEYWAKPGEKAPYKPFMAHHGLEPKQEGHGPWHLTRHPETRAHQVVDNQNRLVESHPGGDGDGDGGYHRAVHQWVQANQDHGHIPKWAGEPETGLSFRYHMGRGLKLEGVDTARNKGESPEDAWGFVDSQHVESHQPAPPFEHTTEDPRHAEYKARPTARTHEPSGFSPEDEWHGPYEVVKHPQSGDFHVVDNAGRRSSIGSGFKEQWHAERSRDYVDRRQQSRDHARSIADSLYDGMAKAMGYENEDAMKEDNRTTHNIERMNDLASTYEGGSGRHGNDGEGTNEEPYYEIEHKGGSGWTARDYGGAHIDVHHKATGDTQHDRINFEGGLPGSFTQAGTKPPGWSEDHMHAALHEWVGSSGKDYADNSDPRIKRWQQRNRYQASRKASR